jgi:hypothetical protein
MSDTCQLCNNTEIPQKIYDLLDWEAVADDDLIICPKCLTGLLKNEANVEIRIQKKTAILVHINWKRRSDDDKEPGQD